MRAALAAALFVTPDLLLLDEVCYATWTAAYFVVCFSFLG
jgi:ABC-type branched-subunit amino acid transport system ATPase component